MCPFNPYILTGVPPGLSKQRFRAPNKSAMEKLALPHKTCCDCLLSKNRTDFGKSKNTFDGLRDRCKECRKKQYYVNHEKSKMDKRLDYVKHKDIRIIGMKKYYDQNSEKIKAQVRKYRNENRDSILVKSKLYRQRPEVKAKIKAYKSTPHERIRGRLNNRIRVAFRRQNLFKNQHTEELLGCSIQEAIDHIKSQFIEGMTMEGLCRGEIQIDHIKPCCAFDLTDPIQQKECFRRENLRPLWAKDNIAKGSKDKLLKIHKAIISPPIPAPF